MQKRDAVYLLQLLCRRVGTRSFNDNVSQVPGAFELGSGLFDLPLLEEKVFWKVKADMCRFSVIIPVYKTEKELPRCIESVLMQDFPDCEIILIDDGSPDSAGAICDSFAEKDPRIHCVHQKNAGLSAARNTGIEQAGGEYILFLDSDDRWADKTALSQIDQVLKESPQTEVLCFGYTLCNEEETVLKICRPTQPKYKSSKYDILKHLTYRYQYYNAAYVKALKREFLLENNIFFERGRLSEDVGWSGRVMLYAKHLEVLPSAFYDYILRRSGSITSSVGMKNLMDILDQIDAAICEIESSEDDDRLKALYYEYWAYQYAAILGDVPRMADPDDYKTLVSRCSKNAFLLKYNHQRKVKLVSWLYAIAGLENTMRVLRIYIERTWR